MKAIDRDAFNAGQVLISEMTKATYEDGTNILVVYKEEEMAKAQKRLEDKSVDLIVEIPKNFSKTLMDFKEGKRPTPVEVKTYGDPANAKYIMAAAWCDSITYHYASPMIPFLFLAAATGIGRLMRWRGRSLAVAVSAFVLAASLASYLLHSPGPLARHFNENNEYALGLQCSRRHSCRGLADDTRGVRPPSRGQGADLHRERKLPSC